MGVGVVGTSVADDVAAEGVEGDVREGKGVAGAAGVDPDALGEPPEPPHAVSDTASTVAAAKSRNGSEMFIGAPGEVEPTVDRLVRLSCHRSRPRHRGPAFPSADEQGRRPWSAADDRRPSGCEQA